MLSEEEMRKLYADRAAAKRERRFKRERDKKALKDARREGLAAEEKRRVDVVWEGRLLKHGWKQNHNGWRLGNRATVPFEQAVAELRQWLREYNETFDAKVADFLTEAGWKHVGDNSWSIPNWDRSGDAYFSLRKAYEIQTRLA